jgi:hypothetical protein
VAATATEEEVNTVSDEPNSPPKNTRPRGQKPFKVWVTPAERASIEKKAAATGLSASTYFRTLALAYEPKSLLDAQHVGELLKLGGDMGRLGGLLKMWLVDAPGRGAPEKNVREVLDEILELRRAIGEKVSSL